jgi:hypothetical protein
MSASGVVIAANKRGENKQVPGFEGFGRALSDSSSLKEEF